MLTSAFATAKIGIQASSSCKLPSIDDIFVTCLDTGVVGFFRLVEFNWFNEILSDSLSISSSNPSINKNSIK